MAFITDQQTLDDLVIFGKSGRSSVYDLFKANTRGGALVLKDMFCYPLSDEEKINKRSSVIRYFMKQEIGFPFKEEWFDAVEYYLCSRDERKRLVAEANTLEHKWRRYTGSGTEYELLHRGVLAGIGIVNGVAELLKLIATKGVPEEYREEYERIAEIVQDPNISWALQERNTKKVTYAKMVDYDRMFRFEGNGQWRMLLCYVYNIDVYVSVAKVAKERGFVFGRALPPGGNILDIEGVYHPLLEGAVPNTLNVDGSNNMIFLTGANMAGKSTFMKAFSISVFLAHMGFPLPVKRMEFSVRNGILTTINLPDDLGMGYSHFYSEVLRVRRVAERVKHLDNLIVVFDELFRGTNVKDAFDATVAVTEAFTAKRSCTFIVSTHIIEAGEVLRERCDNVNFMYFPTVMKGGMPMYTYTLTEGITNDRHGMRIINDEKIVDILTAKRENRRVEAGFAVDKQTLKDLNILGQYVRDSIFNVFNDTCTRGGEQVLEQMFENPLADVEAINERGRVFEFFQGKNVVFPFEKELFDQVERYLGSRASSNRWVAFLNICRLKHLRHVAKEKVYEMICSGLSSTIKFLKIWYDFNVSLGKNEEDSVYAKVIRETSGILESKLLQSIRETKKEGKFSIFELARFDYVLRHICRKELRRLLEIACYTDVYIAVAAVAKKRKFTRATACVVEEGKNCIDITDVFHPRLSRAVENCIRIDHEHNVIFLTGANMAGKSTLMKSFGVAIYLAHMGFPVAAKAMTFAVQDGLYTSINVPDNLNLGYSHFYAEVLRAKHVAEEVSTGKNLVVVFDELFKGTNVKDAYDATVAVAKAFGENRNCSYIISSHITEAGYTLRECCNNFKFVYLPTIMKGTIPTYTYRLEKGITNDRHGMMMINNERIVEIIKGV